MSTVEHTGRVADTQGRTIGYAEFGDPAGFPVVLLHGLGDSRLTRHPDDARTASLGARLITVDAPGIGLSDPVRLRTQEAAAERVLPVLDALGIERFAVLGWSAGGPRALAVASRWPDRVSAVGVAAGFGPLDRPEFQACVTREMRQGTAMFRLLPWTTRVFAGPLARDLGKDPRAGFEKHFGKDTSPADRALLADPALADVFYAGARESARQGPVGLAQEMLLLTRPWGFRPEDVRVPVRLWYGTDDRIVSPETGRLLATLLPDAELTEFPGEGHMALFAHWTELLRALAPAG
jgi:pimeloyl-ACP methyl ester carboxylesterase